MNVFVKNIFILNNRFTRPPDLVNPAAESENKQLVKEDGPVVDSRMEIAEGIRERVTLRRSEIREALVEEER